jgi:hypothetical protein
MQSLEKQIQDIIDQRVEKKLSELTNNDNAFKEVLQDHIEDLNYQIKDAKANIGDYKDDNLTISKVEEEGYLRCLITMKNRLEYNLKLEE